MLYRPPFWKHWFDKTEKTNDSAKLTTKLAKRLSLAQKQNALKIVTITFQWNNSLIAVSIQNYVKDLEFEAFILNECNEVFPGSHHHLAHGLVTVPTMLHCHTTLAPFGVYLYLINFAYFTTNFQNCLLWIVLCIYYF
jgi:hypothetical protein